MRNLNLDQLEALREVVALGSFSAAARRLNLTQPAISLQVKQLDEPLVAVLPPEAAAPARLAAADFAGMPLILYERGGTTSRVIEGWFGRAGITVKPVMELGSAEAIKRLVGIGLGRSILPEISVRAEAASGELAIRPLAPALARTLALIHRRDKPAEAYLDVTL